MVCPARPRAHTHFLARRLSLKIERAKEKETKMKNLMIDRRTILGWGLGLCASLSRQAWAKESGPTAVVKTTNGPVRGIVENDVQTFKGLRYGAPPVGSLRFMPPQEPKPWAEVAEATHTGAASMQLRSGGSAVQQPPLVAKALGEVFTTSDDVARQDEDCLFLNVWTPQLGGAKKRPVMVWLHGGGFNYGSGSWPSYDGHNLASRHDVVVVGVNHRLNAYGYLYLGELGGDAFATSGNAGQLDLIAVLEWVRDNIAEFGGDPGNVTIFGQSGGGAKVSCLLAMPAAKNLFHRGIIESGPGLRGITKQAGTEIAKALFTEPDRRRDRRSAESGRGRPALRAGGRRSRAACSSLRSRRTGVVREHSGDGRLHQGRADALQRRPAVVGQAD